MSSFLFDISLRLITILSRAFFTFYIAKRLSIEDFSVYTYIIANLAFFVYLAGGDFYVYAHREMLTGKITKAQTVKSQIIFMLFSVLLTSSITTIVSIYQLTNFQLIILPLLLLGEALSTESIRFLIAIRKPTASNIINFLKTASWMLPLLITSYQGNILTIEIVMEFWLGGLVIALLVSLYSIPVTYSQLIDTIIPKRFFRNALKVLPKILIGTIALRALFSLDRLAVGYQFDALALSSYGFFVAVASAYLAAMDAGILARLFPALVTASNSHYALANKYRRKLEISALIGGTLALIFFYLFIDHIINYTGKTEFITYKPTGAIILLAYIFYVMSMGVHYILYGKNLDKKIMATHIIALIPFLLMLGLSRILNQPILIAFGILIAVIFQFSMKTYHVKKHA